MLQKLKKINQRTSLKKTSSIDVAESRMRNDRQSIFALARDLVHAQFELGDHELTNRLWQDVIDRGIDMERIINLMYSCNFHDDDSAMLDADLAYESLIKVNQV